MTQDFFDVAVQASYNVIHTDCLDCGEPIQNLLCPNCIAKHFKQWINSYPKLKKQISKELEKFLKAHQKYADYSTCSACQQNTCYECPYCFTEYLLNLLKKYKASDEILQNYFKFFNYDFGHYGYFIEIDKLGMY